MTSLLQEERQFVKDKEMCLKESESGKQEDGELKEVGRRMGN